MQCYRNLTEWIIARDEQIIQVFKDFQKSDFKILKSCLHIDF